MNEVKNGNPRTAVVAGAAGGIGTALTRALSERPDVERVFALSRRICEVEHPKVQALELSDYRPEALTRAMRAVEKVTPRVHLLIVSIGMLHDASTDPPIRPEKSLSEIDADGFIRVMTANALTPLRMLQAFAPLLRHPEGSVTVALSAMVGSIADNRIGGWYSYRMSKAALNMAIRNAAIELGRLPPRGSPRPIVAAIHPGTTVTALSEPFLRRHSARPAAHSAARILEVIDRLTPEDSGEFFNWDGSRLPW